MLTFYKKTSMPSCAHAVQNSLNIWSWKVVWIWRFVTERIFSNF